jgi:DNA-binding NarL/FixJ family response regulator
MHKCLIIEDQKPIRKKIAETISLIPKLQIIAESESGNEAITLINELNPDVIILDIRLKDINGIEVLSEMKNKGINIPVIVFTQFENSRYKERCKNLGASYYLLKKDGLEQIKDALYSTLYK